MTPPSLRGPGYEDKYPTGLCGDPATTCAALLIAAVDCPLSPRPYQPVRAFAHGGTTTARPW
jgi:hypothetical protein